MTERRPYPPGKLAPPPDESTGQTRLLDQPDDPLLQTSVGGGPDSSASFAPTNVKGELPPPSEEFTATNVRTDLMPAGTLELPRYELTGQTRVQDLAPVEPPGARANPPPAAGYASGPGDLVLERESDTQGSAPLVFAAGARRGPVSVGHAGEFRIEARGVLAVHAYLMFDGEGLYISSTDPANPALVEGAPMPRDWTEVSTPCVMTFGRGRVLAHPAVVRQRAPQPTPEMVRPVQEATLPRHDAEPRPRPQRPRPPIASTDDESTRLHAEALEPRGPEGSSPTTSESWRETDSVPTQSVPVVPRATTPSEPSYRDPSDQDAVYNDAVATNPAPPAPPIAPTLPLPAFPEPTRQTARAKAAPVAAGPAQPVVSMQGTPGTGAATRRWSPFQRFVNRARAELKPGAPRRTPILIGMCTVLAFVVAGTTTAVRNHHARVAQAAAPALPRPMTQSTASGSSEAPPPAPGIVVYAAPVRAAFDAGAVRLGTNPRKGVDAGPPTLERSAVDALNRADLPAALTLYKELAQQQPDNPAFANAVRVLEERMQPVPQPE